uniref:Uncharacterized protein n=1 Tax=Phocoena sinus TaxID=42100 RepID=A0A8C9BPG5_PHOSS
MDAVRKPMPQMTPRSKPKSFSHQSMVCRRMSLMDKISSKIMKRPMFGETPC